jgi:hypothetical protein
MNNVKWQGLTPISLFYSARRSVSGGAQLGYELATNSAPCALNHVPKIIMN